MANYNRSGFLGSLPPVTKNLLIINVVVFLLSRLLQNIGYGYIPNFLILYTFGSPHFNPIQLVTHMFMHGGWAHIFFNMFGLFLFGRVLEAVIGSKKFFILYFASGLGAALLQLAIFHIQFHALHESIAAFKNAPSPDAFVNIIKSKNLTLEGRNFVQNYMAHPDSADMAAAAYANLNQYYTNLTTNMSMLGASGAIFGVLAAFAYMFPNVELMLIFLPIPIKAKYFVPIYAVLELFLGVAHFSGDDIAHFAHLGGAIVGFILIKIWKNNQFKML